jgi:hypothetical protein
MLRLKVRSVGMISAVLLAMVFVIPSSAAMASGKSCQQEPNGPLQTCAAVNGSGLHINSLQGSVFNEGNRDVTGVHIQLTWPSGATIKNCSSRTVAPGQTITCTWSPNANEPKGNYCANSWQLVSGHQIQRGHACVDVHS